MGCKPHGQKYIRSWRLTSIIICYFSPCKPFEWINVTYWFHGFYSDSFPGSAKEHDEAGAKDDKNILC